MAQVAYISLGQVLTLFRSFFFKITILNQNFFIFEYIVNFIFLFTVTQYSFTSYQYCNFLSFQTGNSNHILMTQSLTFDLVSRLPLHLCIESLPHTFPQSSSPGLPLSVPQKHALPALGPLRILFPQPGIFTEGEFLFLQISSQCHFLGENYPPPAAQTRSGVSLYLCSPTFSFYGTHQVVMIYLCAYQNVVYLCQLKCKFHEDSDPVYEYISSVWHMTGTQVITCYLFLRQYLFNELQTQYFNIYFYHLII